MSDTDGKKPLGLGGAPRSGQVKQSFSHGRTKSVVVEVKRKLTVVVQLSDPADYAGGALELWPDSATHTAPALRGTATIFPSFMLHRVTPVTEGTRWSLTLWAHGPSFR